jgi:hypothetical protein
MGPIISLDAVAKRKNPNPCRESNHGRPARSLVTVLTELPWLHIITYMDLNETHVYCEERSLKLTEESKQTITISVFPFNRYS